MAATRNDISEWFDRGINLQAKYMVVLCDTFDWEDYPCFFNSAEAAQCKKAAPGLMQKVMEIYDLLADKNEQMNKHRVMAL